MSIRKRFVAIAMTGALAGAGLVGSTTVAAGAVTQGEVTAQSCYQDWTYDKPAGTRFMPEKYLYITTSNCADINIKTGTNRTVRVCFYASGGGLNYCQSSYKTTTAGEWKVIASDVKDGTKFRFEFNSTAASRGYRAH
ncbi:hypothetical protein QFZ55_005149 [Streptomyces luteogriseus]|uniref:hypothetical protein n=1 Tax=Streptomyces luteogriseus TaxID=68233 RepID=UPI002781FB52|nr:hypothetical protein [Streptomyces luteogriseus]MDQ0715697.1 hypothetical protein [Streptomyces luteogriseus]